MYLSKALRWGKYLLVQPNGPEFLKRALWEVYTDGPPAEGIHGLQFNYDASLVFTQLHDLFAISEPEFAKVCMQFGPNLLQNHVDGRLWLYAPPDEQPRGPPGYNNYNRGPIEIAKRFELLEPETADYAKATAFTLAYGSAGANTLTAGRRPVHEDPRWLTSWRRLTLAREHALNAYSHLMARQITQEGLASDPINCWGFDRNRDKSLVVAQMRAQDEYLRRVLVDQLLWCCQQWVEVVPLLNGTPENDKQYEWAPFMMGLMARTLIAYHKYGEPICTQAQRVEIVKKLAHLAPVMFGTAWRERGKPDHPKADEHFGMFERTYKDYAAPDLSLLIFPMYAWLAKMQPDVRIWRHVAILLFESGVRHGFVAFAKQYCQAHLWSLEGLKWLGIDPLAKQPK